MTANTALFSDMTRLWVDHADRYARVINILEDLAEYYRASTGRAGMPGHYGWNAKHASLARNAVARALLASNKFFKRRGVDTAMSNNGVSLVGLSNVEAMGLCADYLRTMARGLETLVCEMSDDGPGHDAGAKAVDLLHRAEKALSAIAMP